MDNTLAAELAFAAAAVGHPTLRFNFSGVGASQGSRSTLALDWLDDVNSALALAADNVSGAQTVVVALQASALLALSLEQDTRVAGIALVNPTLLTAADLPALPSAKPLLLVVAESEAQRQATVCGAVRARDGQVEVVLESTRTFQRNLPLVGKALQRMLKSVERQAS